MTRAVPLASLLLVSLAGCSDPPPPPRFEVTFIAERDPGEPLAGVTFHGPKGTVGTTGEDGTLRVAIKGKEGMRVPFRVECPAGHVPEREQVDLKLTRLRSFGEQSGLRVTVRCPPAERRLVVAVRARDVRGRSSGRGRRRRRGRNTPESTGLAGLTVRVDGRPAATTDADGIAHLLLEGQPGQSFTIRLDTTGQERIRPQNPARVVTIGDHHKITVFDQPFERKRKRRPTRKRTPPAPRPIGPVPID